MSEVDEIAETPAEMPRWRGWLDRVLPALPIVIVVVLIARAAIGGIVGKLGHPGAALDDSYIHFQYARAFAEGHPFRYQAGEPISTGATSVLWPILLAPFWAVGFRDEAILWPAWAMSFAALGLLAWETFQLAKRLTGPAVAAGAAAMVLGFSAFTWCAASGMEVVPFAWVIARTVRRSAEWAEGPTRTRRRAIEIAALAWAASLLRPEGALFALFAAGTLFALPLEVPATTSIWQKRVRGRVPAIVALLGAFALPLLLLALTGSPKSNTTVAKLMVGNPYYPWPYEVARAQIHQLLTDILDGGRYSQEFLPHGGALVAVAGLVALVVSGYRRDSLWRAAGILLLALTMLAPCFYTTFLWNRLRYLWPFSTGWLVGLACLARAAGDLAALARPRLRMIGPVIAGGFAGMFATHLEGVIGDVAHSASGIDRQQVAMGRWAKQALPQAARIGVNDTGAIAYFSDRRTFDIVGLTTSGEARYWVGGVGSRFEHYERLHRDDPGALPTHFIVYPEWMGTDAVFGKALHEATVLDEGRSILGGDTMRAYGADYEYLGSGDRPWSETGSVDVIDALDVADLESEAGHRYALLDARDGDEIVHTGTSPDGATVLDGGRTHRTAERFVARLRPGVATRVIVRASASYGVRAHVTADGADAGTMLFEGEGWEERQTTIGASSAKEETPIAIDFEGGAATTYHVWFVTTGPATD